MICLKHNFGGLAFLRVFTVILATMALFYESHASHAGKLIYSPSNAKEKAIWKSCQCHFGYIRSVYLADKGGKNICYFVPAALQRTPPACRRASKNSLSRAKAAARKPARPAVKIKKPARKVTSAIRRRTASKKPRNAGNDFSATPPLPQNGSPFQRRKGQSIFDVGIDLYQ